VAKLWRNVCTVTVLSRPADINGLGDTQTGGIDRDEGGSHFEIWHRLQETHDLVPRQHGWQCVRPAGMNLLGYLLLSEGRAVEES
jgi:hypothetical protein